MALTVTYLDGVKEVDKNFPAGKSVTEAGNLVKILDASNHTIAVFKTSVFIKTIEDGAIK